MASTATPHFVTLTGYWYELPVLRIHMADGKETKLSVLAVICSISTFQPRFHEPFLRPVRAATFGSLAIFTMVPVLHGICKHGWVLEKERMGVIWVLRTLALNIFGATAYALKVCRL